MKVTHTCFECDGTGEIEGEIDLSEWLPPQKHSKKSELEALVADAVKAQSDYVKLCELNPRAKESYDRQLAETLEKLETSAKNLL